MDQYQLAPLFVFQTYGICGSAPQVPWPCTRLTPSQRGGKKFSRISNRAVRWNKHSNTRTISFTTAQAWGCEQKPNSSTLVSCGEKNRASGEINSISTMLKKSWHMKYATVRRVYFQNNNTSLSIHYLQLLCHISNSTKQSSHWNPSNSPTTLCTYVASQKDMETISYWDVT